MQREVKPGATGVGASPTVTGKRASSHCFGHQIQKHLPEVHKANLRVRSCLQALALGAGRGSVGHVTSNQGSPADLAAQGNSERRAFLPREGDGAADMQQAGLLRGDHRWHLEGEGRAG